MPAAVVGLESDSVDDRRTNRVTGLLVDWAAGTGAAHQRLATGLRRAITSGQLAPGDRLPPSRVLAADLGVSRWLVTECYQQLAAEGYLQGRVGAGTVVAGEPGRAGTAATGTRRSVPQADERPPAITPGHVHRVGELAPRLPDLTAFPRRAWRTAMATAVASVTSHELGYPDPAGVAGLRATLSGYLRRVRGLTVGPDDVVVTHGAGHALAVIYRALAADGARRVGVEEPGWPTARQAACRAGLLVVPVAVDAHGISTDRLAQLRLDAVYLTPTHQYPTGVALASQRRRELVDWAGARGAILVEDDYDAEFRYDRHPVGALAALAPDRVVYVGTTSKTLAPALRLGWMAVPSRLRRSVLGELADLGSSPPVLDQLALRALVESGGYDRHLRAMRRAYRARRAALLTALDGRLPGEPATSIPAGVLLLWHLPADADEAATLARARADGLDVHGLGSCRAEPGPPGLLIGIAGALERRSVELAERLAAAYVRRG